MLPTRPEWTLTGVTSTTDAKFEAYVVCLAMFEVVTIVMDEQLDAFAWMRAQKKRTISVVVGLTLWPKLVGVQRCRVRMIGNQSHFNAK